MMIPLIWTQSHKRVFIAPDNESIQTVIIGIFGPKNILISRFQRVIPQDKAFFSTKKYSRNSIIQTPV